MDLDAIKPPLDTTTSQQLNEVGHSHLEKNATMNSDHLAIKILASLGSVITNSLMTVTVGLMKLTGFTVIASKGIGVLNIPLTMANKFFAKHSFTPLQKWAKLVGEEDYRIRVTDKVVIFSKEVFDPKNLENYKKAVKDSFKATIFPISLALSLTTVAVWAAVKIFYVAGVIGAYADLAVYETAFKINKFVGQFTYEPATKLADYLANRQKTFVNYIIEKDLLIVKTPRE